MAGVVAVVVGGVIFVAVVAGVRALLLCRNLPPPAPPPAPHKNK